MVMESAHQKGLGKRRFEYSTGVFSTGPSVSQARCEASFTSLNCCFVYMSQFSVGGNWDTPWRQAMSLEKRQQHIYEGPDRTPSFYSIGASTRKSAERESGFPFRQKVKLPFPKPYSIQFQNGQSLGVPLKSLLKTKSASLIPFD